ncbi:MAG: hypothetical protein ACR2QV_01835 [Gammaproteobacteria bacterium]
MKSLPTLMLFTALAATVSTRGHAEEAEPAAADEIRFEMSDKRSNIRAGVIDWIKERNATVGLVSDFALPGSKAPLHLDIDPGDDEFVIEWDIKFR